MRRITCMIAMLLAWTATDAHATVRSAVHEGVWTKEHVEWTSRFDPEVANTAWRLELAVPMPRDATFRGEVGTTVTPVVNDVGQIVALDLHGERAVWSTTVFSSVPRSGPVDPPFARDVVQRVEVVGATVRPPPGSPLELRLADVRHVDLDTADRQALSDRWGRPSSPRPVVLVADEAFVAAGGLSPSLHPEDRTGVFVALGVSLLFVLVVLIVGIRLAGRHVEHEEADAYLRRHEPSLAEDLGGIG